MRKQPINEAEARKLITPENEGALRKWLDMQSAANETALRAAGLEPSHILYNAACQHFGVVWVDPDSEED